MLGKQNQCVPTTDSDTDEFKASEDLTTLCKSFILSLLNGINGKEYQYPRFL